MVWILHAVFSMQQLLSYRQPVYSPAALRAHIQGTVVLSYRIGKDGAVEDIETVSGHPYLIVAAGTNLATWRFDRASTSVEKRRATFIFEISDKAETKFSDADMVVVRAPIPEHGSKSGCPVEAPRLPDAPLQPSDFVRLSRTACYGRCPVYTVRLFADGRIEWEGKKNVAKVGQARHSISSEAARALLEKFRAQSVWSLCSNYRGPETDHPTADVLVAVGGHEKAIGDYASAAPKWFRELRAKIDEVAEIHDFYHGSPLEEPLENVRGEGYGKPGAAEVQSGNDPNAQDASGWTPLMYAAAKADRKAIEQLLRAGADPKHVSKRGETVLMAAAVWGVFDAALAKACGNIDAQDRNGMTVLMHLAKSGQPDAVEAAIAAGADVRMRDRMGRTALQYVRKDGYRSEELRRLLSGK